MSRWGWCVRGRFDELMSSAKGRAVPGRVNVSFAAPAATHTRPVRFAKRVIFPTCAYLALMRKMLRGSNTGSICSVDINFDQVPGYVMSQLK